MKKFKILLMSLAVIVAMGGALASTMFTQAGWYDSNGPSSGGGTIGTITTPPGDTPVCGASGTNICRIQVGVVTHNAFVTQANAEANGGANNPSAPGLLKYAP